MKHLKLISYIVLSVIAIMIMNATGLSAENITIANVGALVAFERGVFQDLQIKYPRKSIEPSHLRIQKTLTNNNGTYSFDLKDVNSLQVNEKGLNTNDIFVCTRLGLFLIKEDTDRPGTEILRTYPHATDFSGSGFTLNDLEVIYSAGSLEIKSNQTVGIEALSGIHFRRVGDTTNLFNPMDAFHWLTTPLTFDGGKTTEIKYSFPPPSDMKIASVTAGYTHRLVFMPMGFLIKGAATK